MDKAIIEKWAKQRMENLQKQIAEVKAQKGKTTADRRWMERLLGQEDCLVALGIYLQVLEG